MVRTLALFFLAAIIASASASAAQQKPVLVTDGVAATDWHSLPPTFTLTPASAGARSGQVWIRKTPDGLLVAGHVDGPAPVFAASAAQLKRKDHVEISLAVEPNPQLPLMGWGNQFGDTNLPKGELSCLEIESLTQLSMDKDAVASCQIWVRKQLNYRTHLKRLFARRWKLAPWFGVESFATPAYHAIEKIFPRSPAKSAVDLPKQLKPKGVPVLKAKLHPGAGYDFETLVSWKLFPPAGDPTLQELYLIVEVFAAAPPARRSGAYSTTAPGRGHAEFPTFSRIQFAEPKHYRISPCQYPSAGVDFWDNPTKGYFFPSNGEVVAETFVLENYRGGYAYEPTGLSPEARPSKFFWKEPSPGEYVCGPPLRYFKDGVGTVLKSDARKRRKAGAVSVDRDGLNLRRLPDGLLLIRNGPHTTWSKFGTGQCGLCPYPELVIFSLDESLRLSELLDISEQVGNSIEDMDIQISPEWDRVGVFRHMQDADSKTWDNEFYCLKERRYQECGAGRRPPPKPRTLRPNDENVP